MSIQDAIAMAKQLLFRNIIGTKLPSVLEFGISGFIVLSKGNAK